MIRSPLRQVRIVQTQAEHGFHPTGKGGGDQIHEVLVRRGGLRRRRRLRRLRGEGRGGGGRGRCSRGQASGLVLDCASKVRSQLVQLRVQLLKAAEALLCAVGRRCGVLLAHHLESNLVEQHPVAGGLLSALNSNLLVQQAY